MGDPQQATQSFDPDQFMASRQGSGQEQPHEFDPDTFMAQRQTQSETGAGENKGLWDSVKDAAKTGWGNSGLGLNTFRGIDTAVGNWADRKMRGYAHENELAANAGQKPAHGRAAIAGLGMLRDTEHLGTSLTSPESTGIGIAAMAAPEIVAPALVAHGLYTGLKHGGSIADLATRGEADPDELQQSLLGFSESAGGGAAAKGTIDAATGRARTALTGGMNPTLRQTLAETNTGRGISRIGDTVSPITERLRVPGASRALTQAIQPGINVPRAGESIDIAGPRLQQLKQAGVLQNAAGEPITEFKTPADLLEGVKGAKAHVWDAIEQRLGPVADLQADTSPIADAMEKSISKRTENQFPQLADRIQARADTYRHSMSLRDIEDSIQDANNDLRNFYKRPGATDSPIGPDMAATEAEVRSLRSMLDEKVSDLRGDSVKDLKREYGALRDVEKATARANAVATRQKGATLWEGLAALRAAGDFVSGNVLGAAKGAGTLAVGRWLAKLRDPNFLIDQAFQGRKGFEPAQPIPRPPIDVVQGEFVPPRTAVRAPNEDAPPISVAPRTALPSAQRPALSGRTLDQPPVVTPPPQAPRRLTTPLGEPTPAGLIPRRQLPPAGGLNHLPSSEVPIIPQHGRPRALPPPNPIDQIPPNTPETGIRTVGGQILDRAGQGIGWAAEPEASGLIAPNVNIPRARLADINLRMEALNDQMARARSFNVRKSLLAKQKRLSAERNSLRDDMGLGPLDEPDSSEATYENLPAEERKWIDNYAKQIEHMPQSLRESEVRDLQSYGGATRGLSRKELLARRRLAELEKTREPGDDTPF